MGKPDLKTKTRLAIGELLDRVLGSVAPRHPATPSRALDLSELEERILLSASPMLAVAEMAEPAPAEAMAEESALMTTEAAPSPNSDSSTSQQSNTNLSTNPSQNVSHEVVFLDTSVEDYQQLLNDLWSNDDPSREIEVVLLSGTRDGIDQISEALASRNDLDAIHIVSHGTDAAVKLGSTWLTQDNLAGYVGEIARWGDSLSTDADLLFYGCDLAATSDGQSLIDSLATLTGADVAASDNDTGHAIFDADWDLEYATGQIETQIAFSQATQDGWGHIMNVAVEATSTGTIAKDNLSGTISHTTSGSNRLMLVGISFGQDHDESIASVTYNGANLTLVGTRDNGDSSKSRVEIWSLLAPDIGTHDVVVNVSDDGHDGVAIGVMTFTNVDQGTPLGTFASAQGDSSTASATVGSASGELVFGVVAIDNSSNLALTPGSGQAEQWDLFADDKGNGGGSTESGAASVTTSWTWGSSDKWVVGGVSIKPAANGSTSTSFRNGDSNGYSSTVDTFLDAGEPTTDKGSDVDVAVDLDDGAGDATVQGLIRFDSIFGSAADQIPSGATITSAQLRLNVNNPSIGSATIGLHQMLVNWTDSSTWNSLSSGVSTNGVEAASAADATISDPTATGSVTVSGLESTVQAWLDGDSENYGWVIVSDSDNGWDFDSSDSLTAGLRPQLLVSYIPNTAPVLNDTVVTLNSVAEDTGAPSGAVGTLISTLVDLDAPAGGQDNVTDDDTGAATGLAITAADTTNGTWHYSINGGSNWNALGTVSTTNALLLAADADTRIYFQGNSDYNGTIANAITFHAWDQTSGTNGGTADVSTSNPTVLDQFSTVAYTSNDGTTNWTSNWTESDDDGAAATGNIRVEGDELRLDNLDGGSFESITRSFDLANASAANLTFDFGGYVFSGTDNFAIDISNDGGSNWVELEEISYVSSPGENISGNRDYDLTSFVSLTTDMAVRFRVSSGFAGAGQHVAFDNIQVASTVDRTGGATAFSNATDTASITVTPVNDDPVATIVPITYGFSEDSSALTLSGLNVSDVDADSGDVEVSLSVNDGDLTLVTATGLSFTGGANGSSSITVTGTLTDLNNALDTLTYQPDLNYFGSDTFTLTIDDQGNTGGGDLTDFDTAGITVSAVNDDPENGGSLPTDIAVAEDVSSNVDLSAVDFSDVDADSGTLTVTLTTSTGGQLSASSFAGVSVNGTATARTFTGTLTNLNNYFDDATRIKYLHGTANTAGDNADLLTVIINDNGNTGTGGGLDQVLGTVNVDITADNDAPTISAIADQTPNEDTATGDIAFTVSDVETAAGSLVVTATSDDQTLVPDANITLGGSGANRTINVLPGTNQNGGPATITVSVFDGTDTTQTTFDVTVSADNDAPTISAIADQTPNEDTATGNIAFTISDVETAAGSLIVTATSDDQTIVPDANITLGGSGANRTINILPGTNQNGGPATITVSVFDGTDTTQTTFDVTVSADNDAPTISAIADQTPNEDTATGNIAFTIGDVETAAGSLIVTATSDDQTLVPDANITLGGSGASRTINILPGTNQNGGPATITVSVFDGTDTTQTTFDVTVSADNDAPTISAIADQTPNEDTATGNIAFTISDVETAAGSLIVTATSDDQTLVPDANITLGGSGANRTINVLPGTNQNGGPATITVSVSVFDGTDTTQTTFDVTVSADNDAPTISAIADQTPNEDTATGNIAFTISDVETAAGSLIVTATSDDQTLVPDANITLGGSGANRTINILPGTNQNGGPATITVSVFDGTDTTQTTFDVTVSADNDAPTISAIADQTPNEDTATGNIAFTIGDVETAAGSLIVTATSDDQTLVPDANITLGGSGASRTINILPGTNQNGGPATITVSVFDGTDTTQTTFDVTVSADNDAPTISAIADQTPNEDTATGDIAFTVSDVETAAGSLTVTPTSDDQTIVPDGNITLGGSGANRTINILPGSNQNGGPATITVSVFDGTDTTQTTFDVTVTAVNDAPVFDPSGLTTFNTITEDQINNAGQTVASVIASVGGDRITDVDSGDPEGIAIIAAAETNGTLEYSLNGGTNWNALDSVATNNALLLRETDLIRFNPDGKNGGTSAISFHAWDQSSGTAGNKVDATTTGDSSAFSVGFEGVLITVTDVNDNPSGAGSLTTTSLNDNDGATNLFGGLSVTDVDTGEADLSLTITLATPSAGTLSGGGFTETAPSTGIYTVSGLTTATADTALDNVQFTPTDNTGPSGTFNTDMSVTANDQGGGGEQTVLAATIVTVTRVNDAPVADLNGADGAGADYSTTFNEGNTPVSVADTDATISDADDSTFQNLGVNLSGFVDGTSEEIHINGEIFTYSVSKITTTTVGTTLFNLDFDGTGFTIADDGGGTIPEADIQALLRIVSYENTSLNPTAGNRTFNIIPQDSISLNGTAAVSMVSVSGVNTRPTLTAFAGSVDTTLEDTEVEVTFAELATQGNESDPDGTVTAFIVKSVLTGTLKIGLTAGTATAYSAGSNNVIDATRNAYWTPTLNSNGTGNAFTVVARDNLGLESIGNIAVPVEVTPVNDAPTITAIADQTPNEDTATGAIAFTVGDVETAAGSLTVTATSSDQTLVPDVNITLGGSGASRTINVLPGTNQNGGPATITVSVFDGTETTQTTFDVTVSADNDAPTITVIADQTPNEDTATGAIAFTVGDAETAAGSLIVTATSNDQTLVPDANITLGGSGASRTINVLPGTNQNGGPATITVSVFDGTETTQTTFDVTVTAVNDAPVASISLSGYGVDEDDSQRILTGVSVSDVDADGNDVAVTVSVDDGDLTVTTTTGLTFTAGANGSSAFTAEGTISELNAALGTLRYQPDPNFNGTDTFTLFVDDLGNSGGGSLTSMDSVPITVTAENDAPLLDLDADDSSLTTGNDFNQSFEEGAGPVSLVDADATLSDIDSANLASITVSLTNRLDPASKEELSADTSGTLLAAAWDSGTDTLTIDGSGTIAAYLTVLNTVAYDNTANNPDATTRTITFVANDGTSNSLVATTTLTFSAVNDAPVINSDGGAGTAAVSVAENVAEVTTVASTDVDGGTPVYSISGGADSTKFSIDNGTGILKFVSAPDFESPTDTDSDNDYEVTVQVSDQNGGFDTQTITVTVTAENDNDPVITSDGGGASFAVDVAENSTAVTTVTATDADLPAQTLSYSISGGADSTKFNIDSDSGVLTFATAPDFDSPSDTDGDNEYEVTVEVSDGAGRTDSQDITVSVTDLNDTTPIVDGGQSFFVIESATDATSLGNVTATDPDTVGSLQNWTIVSGNTSSAFAIDSASGELTVNNAATLDFETLPTFTLTVRVSDGSNTSADQTVTVNVTNANDAPLVSAPASDSVDVGETLTFAAANGNAITVSDVEESELRIQLSVDDGTLTLSGDTGLVFSGWDGNCRRHDDL